jgi:aspartyl-tRNA(Asn)/glutamyl-tRNA(Gln) amidotransferase subunit C
MISKQEVKHIAKLARLSLAKKEEGKLQKELSAILDYIEKLKEVDIKGVEPTSHSIPVKNIFREDKVKKADLKAKKKLVDKFPARKDNYLKVKSIF